MGSGDLAVGIDVGGTKLAAGLVTGDGTVVRRLRRQTPAHDGGAVSGVIVDAVAELSEEQGPGLLPVGIGAAGIVDLSGVIRYSPNITWRDFPLQQEVVRATNAPVLVENDANAAAWAEYRVGAGSKAEDSLVMLTLGTGVGGGLVLGDRLVRGHNGMAAEFGHLLVAEGGPPCPCGNRGCLEAMSSGRAVGHRALEAHDEGAIPEGSTLAGLPREQLTGRVVTAAGRDGDVFARSLLSHAGRWLGVGIAGLVHALDPEIVVVGGGAMEAGELLLEPARAAFVDRLLGRAHRPVPEIVPAALADDAGLVGAALLALEAAGPAATRPPRGAAMP